MPGSSTSIPAARFSPPLDPDFMPFALVSRAIKKNFRNSSGHPTIQFALEQSDGSVSHFDTSIPVSASPESDGIQAYVERQLKFLLWSRGGCRVHYHGPPDLGAALKRYYADTEAGRFDAKMMGSVIYDQPFEFIVSNGHSFPAARENTRSLGRHLDGCRIGFDLGASDRKVAAVIDGDVVFSEEVAWNPVPQSDPQWHFDQLMAMLSSATAHLPRVDAIGGSAAGVYVNNRVKVASLFRGISADVFASRVSNIFFDLKKAWHNVPFEVVNDGEVTALAGSMALNANAVLGIAMGSSQAAGYVTDSGRITSWLNELAFSPIDCNPAAPVDEWSGDRGCGVQYFSQQCVGRLLAPAGIECAPGLGLPEKLKYVQELMQKDDPRARALYETIGTYLGYAVALYADFYTIDHILLLGRVLSGPGGNVIIDTAAHVLSSEFPELAERIAFNTPDERSKRHGQAIAAASLPCI